MTEEQKTPPRMFPVDMEGSPKIVLAGREWAIPPLAIKQARVVVPKIMSLGSTIFNLSAIADGEKDQAAIVAAMSSLSDGHFDTIIDVVYAALQRGYPQLARGEFDDMPVTPLELFAALPTVLAQVGFVKKQDAKPGEQQAGSAPTAQ